MTLAGQPDTPFPYLWHCNVCGFVGMEHHLHRRDLNDPSTAYTDETQTVPQAELTDEQRDAQFMHHTATGGDLVFLVDGRAIAC